MLASFQPLTFLTIFIVCDWTGIVEFEISMATSENNSANNTFSTTFALEVALAVKYEVSIRLQEDQDDHISFSCALSASFVPLTSAFPQASAPWSTNVSLIGTQSNGQGRDGGGGNFLYDAPQYVFSGNGCWELQMHLVPDRYGNHTYAVHVLTDTLSGQRSVSFHIQIVADAVNDAPQFVMPEKHITVDESPLLSWYENAVAVHNISAGAFEPLQSLTFELSFISGNVHLLDPDVPVIHPNGTLNFRPARWQRGSALYSVVLVDENPGTNTSIPQYLSLFVRPRNRAPSFVFYSAAGVGWSLEAAHNVSHTASLRGSTFLVYEDYSLMVSDDISSLVTFHGFAHEINGGLPLDKFENQQLVTFEFHLLDGDDSIFATPPVITANGSLILQILPHHNGRLHYNLTLMDNGCAFLVAGTDIATCVAECLQRSNHSDQGWDACSQICVIDDGQTFSDASTCLGENRSIEHELWLDVASINDAPSFSISHSTLEVLEAQSMLHEHHIVPNFAQNISAGPYEEHAAQQVTFLVSALRAKVPNLPSLSWSNVTVDLFEAEKDCTPHCSDMRLREAASAGEHRPQQLFLNLSKVLISSNGTLEFTLEPFRHGVVDFVCVLADNGGTDLNGINQSQPVTFRVAVLPVNDAPIFALPTWWQLSSCHSSCHNPVIVPDFASLIQGGRWGEQWQPLSFSISHVAGPSELFDSISVVCFDTTGAEYDGTCSTGNASLIMHLKPHYFGNVTLNLTLKDNSSALNTAGKPSLETTKPFHLTVMPKNQPPEFSVRLHPGLALSVEEGSSCITSTESVPGLAISFLARPSAVECVRRQGRLHRHSGIIVIKTLGGFPAYLEGCNGCAAAGTCAQCSCPSGVTCENQTAMFDIACNVSAEGLDPSRLFARPPQVEADGTLVFELLPYASGLAVCSVGMRDVGALDGSQLSSEYRQPLEIRVLPVNNAPSFDLVRSEIYLIEDEGAREMLLARHIVADGVNGSTEIDQNVTFSVDIVHNMELFITPAALPSDSLSDIIVNFDCAWAAVQPRDCQGRIMLQTAPDRFGSARLSVVLHDDGGTAVGGFGNRGVSRSLPQLVDVHVAPVNDVPSFSLFPDILVVKNKNAQGGGLLRIQGTSFVTAGPHEENFRPLLVPARSMAQICRELAPGSKWELIGTQRPTTDTEIFNEALAAALTQRFEFSKTELDQFQVTDLAYNSYIKVGDHYWKPTAASQSSSTSIACAPNRCSWIQALVCS